MITGTLRLNSGGLLKSIGLDGDIICWLQLFMKAVPQASHVASLLTKDAHPPVSNRYTPRLHHSHHSLAKFDSRPSNLTLYREPLLSVRSFEKVAARLLRQRFDTILDHTTPSPTLHILRTRPPSCRRRRGTSRRRRRWRLIR